VEAIEIILWVLAFAVIFSLGWYVTRRRREERPSLPSRVPERPTAPAARAGLGERLSKSSRSLGGALRHVFSRSELDGEFWNEMEEALIGADVGVAAATDIVGRVRARHPDDAGAARTILEEELRAEFEGADRTLTLGDSKPAIVLVVGVNGAGKTTTIAKLAQRLQREGLSPLLGAADTFRAAADAQLRTWGERVGADVVGGQEGADPAAVAYDAYQAARSRGNDLVIVDTAGRLHSKHNLMAELAKIRRVLERDAGSIDEVLLVLDATAGQNGISQVQEFAGSIGITGIVLTKLDGTARGGVVVAVERELGVPVKFIGIGEGVEDLIPFVPGEFVAALLADA
jgi:fused signal recognition particle receptor